jgi:hypothetical protein
MDATTFNARWLRRMSRRDFETFFFGTAMILLAQNKRQPSLPPDGRFLAKNRCPGKLNARQPIPRLRPSG